MLRDVYFLTGLTILGFVSNLVPTLSHGETMDDLCDRNFYTTVYVHG